MVPPSVVLEIATSAEMAIALRMSPVRRVPMGSSAHATDRSASRQQPSALYSRERLVPSALAQHTTPALPTKSARRTALLEQPAEVAVGLQFVVEAEQGHLDVQRVARQAPRAKARAES